MPANVLCLSPDRVISIAENRSVNEQLVRLGFKVVTVPFSQVIKSGGSVRCDTLRGEKQLEDIARSGRAVHRHGGHKQ
jgi:N-dimethylarginine dimethylaminohydrolase